MTARLTIAFLALASGASFADVPLSARNELLDVLAAPPRDMTSR